MANFWGIMCPLFSGFLKIIGGVECRASYFFVRGSFSEAFHDIDSNVYVADEIDYLVCGGFHIRALKKSSSQYLSHIQPIPDASVIERDWDAFGGYIMEKLAKRFSSIMDLEIKELSSFREGYTPDGLPIMGFLPDFRNYFCLTGMSGSAVALCPGLSRIAAQWLLSSEPAADTSKFEVSRFVPLHCNKHYLCQRAAEVAGSGSNFLDPLYQWSTARNLRTSPLYLQFKEAGAVFGEAMGFEQALYFATDKSNTVLWYLRLVTVFCLLGLPSSEIGINYPVGKPKWFPFVASEYNACRERVAIMDISAHSKFEIMVFIDLTPLFSIDRSLLSSLSFGTDEKVVSYLQRLCSASVDRPVGTTVFTGMQNDRGGYVADCTLSRYLLAAPSSQQTRLFLWLMQHIEPTEVITVHDVTSKYTTLNVLGPTSRLLLQELTDQPLDSQTFPAFRCKEVNIGCASSLKAVSVSHCGELGWTLYIPNEFALHVFQELMRLGKSYDVQLCGLYAFNSLRIEKFFVRWGVDITSSATPSECGRLFRVNLNKDFIGKKALLMKSGVRRRFVQLLLKDHDINNDPWPQGNELIYRNGQFCGLTTSAAYAFTLGCQVCLGHVSVDGCKSLREADSFVQNKNFVYEVEIAGKRFGVQLNLYSPKLPMVSSEHPQHYRPTQ
ncbi:Pyruvate dehydrogenase phosphatase regulatory sub unit [Trichuris trichiura]|uniref:Pyruvate dehydrogenase phosphatase regulatory sub unit n=1 Tax=Trichuris trichiura TaxID=36087 RepID=A0A077Z9L5_TRITR|nr:Pyruvate dehydrogenase phosphatase regulatory sub unit [Trichuris trichiura]